MEQNQYMLKCKIGTMELTKRFADFPVTRVYLCKKKVLRLMGAVEVSDLMLMLGVDSGHEDFIIY